MQVKGDTIREANETYAVNLSGAVNGAITDAKGLDTITNDDGRARKFSSSIRRTPAAVHEERLPPFLLQAAWLEHRTRLKNFSLRWALSPLDSALIVEREESLIMKLNKTSTKSG